MVTGLMMTGMNYGTAEASSNDLSTIEQLDKGTQTLEDVKLGEPIQNVIKQYGTPVYSYQPNGKKHFYEFNTKEGLLIVTADGVKNKGNVQAISMSYNNMDGATIDQVTEELGPLAFKQEFFNNQTGNFGYVKKGNMNLQFTTPSPDDKELKLYRIDISK